MSQRSAAHEAEQAGEGVVVVGAVNRRRGGAEEVRRVADHPAEEGEARVVVLDPRAAAGAVRPVAADLLVGVGDRPAARASGAPHLELPAGEVAGIADEGDAGPPRVDDEAVAAQRVRYVLAGEV